MRAIEKSMVNAVRNGRNYSNGNTVVKHDANGVRVYLHGNLIYKEKNGVKSFTLAGWNTVTTRSRLNALGVGVTQKNWTPIQNDREISSCQWYTVED